MRTDIGSSLFEGLKAADGALQARGGIEEIVRSRRQHQIKGNGSARAARVGPANIVNGDCRSCQLHPRWCIQPVPPRPQAGSFLPRPPAGRQNPFPDPQRRAKSVASRQPFAPANGSNFGFDKSQGSFFAALESLNETQVFGHALPASLRLGVRGWVIATTLVILLFQQFDVVVIVRAIQ